MLKHFKLFFRIRLRRRPMLRPSRRCLPRVLQVALLPSTLLRNHTYVKSHVKHQCHPKNIPIGKTKKSLAKQRRLCILYRVFPVWFLTTFSTKVNQNSLSNFSLATEKRQFSTISLSVSIFMRFLSTYLIIRHFCMFNIANCRLLLMFLAILVQWNDYSNKARHYKCLTTFY